MSRQLRGDLMIKFLLKKLLPSPTNTFNGDIQELYNLIEKEQEKTNGIIADLRKKNENSSEVIQLLQSEKNILEKLLDVQKAELEKVNEILGKTQEAMGKADEVIWAQIFNNTITDSKWLADKTFSPGRWAAGYQFLYVLYRALNEVKPKKILELGLGQTTRMIAQYAATDSQILHKVVEHDAEWAEFFKRDFILSPQSELIQLPLFKKSYQGEKLYAYKNFKKTFSNDKFDFISIDGPFGFLSKEYARMDILELLPDCLEKSFVIMIDDYEREGEKNTINLVKKILDNASVPYAFGNYEGQKHAAILTSSDLKFLCSL